MRRRLAAGPLLGLALAVLVACKERPLTERSPRPGVASALASSQSHAPEPSQAPSTARPVSSEVLAVEKAVRRQKLSLPPLRQHLPQLAFGKGVLGQLTRNALRVFDTGDFRLLAEAPLESPRGLIALPDGALLAIGARSVLRWERGNEHPTSLPRPVLLPGAHVYADAQRADALWVFDERGRGERAATAATLQLYRLLPGGEALVLPEQSIELGSPAGGAFGVTREGVWLYLTPGQCERWGPGGARLSKLALGDAALPTWVLPARRLDQSSWVHATGRVTRVLVSPTYKQLGAAELGGRVVAADSGDEGRILAAVLVTEVGPRFELALLDQDLAPRGRVALAAEEPTTGDDWVRVLIENQQVAVAPRSGLLAVGGPLRVAIFDASAKPIFSIPSR